MVFRHCTMSSCLPRWSGFLCGLIVSALLAGCATQVTDPHSSTTPQQASNAYTELGLAYLRRNDLDRAQQALDHALELSATDSNALQGLALLYQRQGEKTLAERFYQRALAAAPDFTQAHNNYAAFLYAQGRFDAACAQLQQATRDLRYPKRAQLYTNLGQCQLQTGNLKDAAESLSRAQGIEPRYAHAYYVQAEVQHRLGQQDIAWEQLQHYFRLAGQNGEGMRLARDIARSRGDTRTAELYSRQLNATSAASPDMTDR